MSSAALATRLALALAVLASCSSDSEPGSDATPAGDAEAASVLEDLTADEFCALLPAESIEQALGVVVEGSEGTERGRAPVMRTPYFLSRECDYSSGLPALNTRLATEWDEDDTDTDVLDRAFTDIVNETVGDYEDVPGLGVVAGFGPNPMLATADVATGSLEVVLRAGDDERLLLSVYTTGRATLDQLRPLAEELIAGLGY